jgi:hypothetical protein
MRRLKTLKFHEFTEFVTHPSPLLLSAVEGGEWWIRQRKIVDKEWERRERGWEKWKEEKLKLIGEMAGRLVVAEIERKDAEEIETIRAEMLYLSDLFRRFHFAFHSLNRRFIDVLWSPPKYGGGEVWTAELREWVAGVNLLPWK